MPRFSSSLTFALSLLVAGLLGFGLVWYSTAWGAGWMSDSFQYISAAVNLAHGRGFVYTLGGGAGIPMTHYPPLYSLLLSPAELLGLDVIVAARLLNALLLGVNAGLVGVSLKSITHSSFFAFIAALLAALAPAMIETHAWVLSEPLFLCLCLISQLFLGRYLINTRPINPGRSYSSPLNNQKSAAEPSPAERQSGVGMRVSLLLSALLAGCAWLTRYAGVSLVFAGTLGLLLLQAKPWRRRIQTALLWLALSLAPMLLWTLRITLTGGFDQRTLAINPMTPKNFGVFLNTLLTWWLPPVLVNGREKLFLAVLAVAILVFLVWLFSRRIALIDLATRAYHSLGRSVHPLLLLHIIFLLTYLVMILALKNILEEGMGLSDRMLIPLYPSSVFLALALLSAAWQKRQLAGKAFVTVVLIYLLGYNGAGAWSHVQDFHQTGFGVSKRAWHESPAVQYMATNVGQPIYSNSPQSVYRWRREAGFPLSSFRSKTRRGASEEALVVIFKYISEEGQYTGLVKDLEILVEDSIAAVYLYKP